MNKLNIGCGRHLMPAEEGWINLDKNPAEPGIIKFDAFKYPWDFPDNSADEFYLSHIIEHIPHEPKPSDLIINENDPRFKRWERLKELDGFFAFFAEMWRIGVNGAKVNIIVPHAYTHGAMQDPTHTRYIVPQTFAYLTQEMHESKDFDYKLPLLYNIKSARMDVANPDDFESVEQFQYAALHLWDMTNNLTVELEIVKNGNVQ